MRVKYTVSYTIMSTVHPARIDALKGKQTSKREGTGKGDDYHVYRTKSKVDNKYVYRLFPYTTKLLNALKKEPNVTVSKGWEIHVTFYQHDKKTPEMIGDAMRSIPGVRCTASGYPLVKRRPHIPIYELFFETQTQDPAIKAAVRTVMRG